MSINYFSFSLAEIYTDCPPASCYSDSITTRRLLFLHRVVKRASIARRTDRRYCVRISERFGAISLFGCRQYERGHPLHLICDDVAQPARPRRADRQVLISLGFKIVDVQVVSAIQVPCARQLASIPRPGADPKVFTNAFNHGSFWGV